MLQDIDSIRIYRRWHDYIKVFFVSFYPLLRYINIKFI